MTLIVLLYLLGGLATYCLAYINNHKIDAPYPFDEILMSFLWIFVWPLSSIMWLSLLVANIKIKNPLNNFLDRFKK